MSENDRPAVASAEQVRIGAPVTPLDADSVELITTLVEGLEAIAEAYLPMVYIPGVIDPPSITLAIVPHPEVQDIAKLAEVLSGGIKLILEGRSMQIIPLTPTHALMDAVRKSETQIFPRLGV